MSTAPDIKAIHASLDWTQDQMAEYLGLDRSSVSRMENGQPLKGPTIRLLEGLAKTSICAPSKMAMAS